MNSDLSKPLSPFLESQNSTATNSKITVVDEESVELTGFDGQTPFMSAYQALEDGEYALDPRQDQFTALLAELYDEEFDQELYELAAEAAEVYRNNLSALGTKDHGRADAIAQQEVWDHFAPVEQDLQIILDNMVAEVDGVDLERMPDSEKTLWVESFFVADELLEGEGPEIEYSRRSRRKRRRQKRKNRWRAFKNKIKKIVKKVGKGLGKIGKQAFKILLKRLGKIAKKLLKQVLSLGGKYIPKRYRPLYEMLRKKLLKKEYADDESLSAWYSEGVAPLQAEFDFYVASTLMGKEDDREMEAWEQETTALNVPDLDEARSEFIGQILTTDENHDLSPQVEHFVTAILQSLRFVAKPIVAAVGRDKVVNALGKQIAKLTGKFIKKKNLNKLVGVALADVGMRLMRLELSEQDERQITAEALTGMVEDTVHKSLAAPAEVFADEALLSAEVLAAFEQAASDNLPPILSSETYRRRPYLRATSKSNNAWVRLPLGLNRHRRYKKAVRSLRRKITPHIAKEVKTFGDIPLESFLTDQMGVEVGDGVEAEIHLYEVLPGTELSDIAQQENYIPGLRGDYSFNYALLHPLTSRAAGLLLGEPALGRAVDPAYLMHRHRIQPGQRFYYLDIANAQPQTVMVAGAVTLRKPSTCRITIDFIRGELSINLYLSERIAQTTAIALKATHSQTKALTEVVTTLTDNLPRNFSAHGKSAVNLVHANILPGCFSGHALRRIPLYLAELFFSRVKGWAMGVLSKHLFAQAENFVTATENTLDGVTLTIVMRSVPGLAEMGKILANTPIVVPPQIFDDSPLIRDMAIRAGY